MIVKFLIKLQSIFYADFPSPDSSGYPAT